MGLDFFDPWELEVFLYVLGSLYKPEYEVVFDWMIILYHFRFNNSTPKLHDVMKGDKHNYFGVGFRS